MTASDAPRAAQRRVFALLIDSLEDEHEIAVVRGATAAADEIDAFLRGAVLSPALRDTAVRFAVIYCSSPCMERSVTSLSLFGLRTNDRCFTACFALVLGLGTLQGRGTSAESPELFGRGAAAGAPAGKAGTSTGGAADTSNGGAGAASGSGGTSSAGAAGASCSDVSSDPNNCGACGHACGSTEQCSGGVCICPPGRSSCTAGCVDLQSDPAHCGTCDRARGSLRQRSGFVAVKRQSMSGVA